MSIRDFLLIILFYFSILFISCFHRNQFMKIITNKEFYYINFIFFSVCILVVEFITHSMRDLLGGIFVQIIIIYYGIFFFWIISRILVRFHKNIIWTYLSYISMSCYFFHRQFLEIWVKLFGEISLLIILLVMIILIYLCYYIQKGYDSIVNHYYR